MSGYTKLFSSIIASTIWRAPNETRLVWITMLALADRHGVVEASIPGLADLARVSVDRCRVALVELAAPDPDSRTPDLEGRRIMPIDGGWSIVNHHKFRQKMSADDRREYLRLKQAEYRAKKKAVNTASTSVAEGEQSTHIAEAEAKAVQDQNIRSTPRDNPRRPARSRSLTVPAGFDAFWTAYPRKVAKPTAIRAWMRQRPPLDAVLDAVTRTTWSDDPHFIPHPSTWLNARRWEDSPSVPAGPPSGLPLAATPEHWSDECRRLGHQPPCPHREAHWIVLQRAAHA